MESNRRIEVLWVPAMIALAALLAYANSFGVPFVFDDVVAIVENPTIRKLSWDAFCPPSGWGLTVSGRPVLNATLALNHAMSGVDVWSYHLTNLFIHTLAGLTVYGIIRRTLAREGVNRGASGADLRGRFHIEPWLIALTAALLWTIHPLQVESVTYVIQRAESLMGLFFLLTLYTFIRSLESPHPRRWMAASFAACLLSAATKEVAVMAPVMVFLYDRTFVAGSFGGAWSRRRRSHLLLASTWMLLAFLVLSTGGNRGGTMGFAAGVSPVGSLLTQFEALTRYLWLAVWPHPLVFDYGKLSAEFGPALLPWAVPVVLLVALTLVALWRWRVAGFFGAWFFGILAPTTLIPGVIQMIVEHRMYLPLAAVLTAAVVIAARGLSRAAFLTSFSAIAVALAAVTVARNETYADEVTLWLDTIDKRPLNARAYNNLGRVRMLQGRIEEAAGLHRESLRLDPTLAQTHFNLGLALAGLGRTEEALEPFRTAVGILPYYFKAHLSLGNALTKLGRAEEALPHYEAALKYDPEPAEEYFRRGVALAQLGRWREAISDYEQAARLEPASAELESNWGAAMLQLGDVAGALQRLERALQQKPGSNEIRFNMAIACAAAGRADEALRFYREIVASDPKHAAARLNLGIALCAGGALEEGMEHLRAAVQLSPDSPEAHTNYGIALTQAGRLDEALAEHETALKLRPDAQAHYNLGYAFLDLGRYGEARARFTEALRLKPDFAAAADILRRISP